MIRTTKLIRTTKFLTAVVLYAGMATCADAAVMVVSGVTTDTSALDGNLTAVTAGGTYSVTAFASATAASENNILSLDGSTPPANASDALSDQRVDTGQLNVGATTVFSVTPSSSSDKLFIIFDAGDSDAFQGPGAVQALDNLDAPIGTPVIVNVDTPDGVDLGVGDAIVRTDAFATGVDFQRIGSANTSNPLPNRLVLGVTIDIADFGVADPTTIAGFLIPGELGPAFSNAGSLDVHAVGVLAIPEPASLVLLGLGFIGVLPRRRW